MGTINSKAAVMKGLQFSAAEKKKNLVRVRLKDFDGAMKVSKWNYRTKRWSKWALLV